MATLANIRLLVNDFPASFRFYRDVIGWRPTAGDENDVYADFDTGDAAIALFKRELMLDALGSEDSQTVVGDPVALVLASDDVDGDVERLQAAGVTIEVAPTDRPEWGIRTAHFRDPTGNLLELYTALEARQ